MHELKQRVNSMHRLKTLSRRASKQQLFVFNAILLSVAR